MPLTRAGPVHDEFFVLYRLMGAMRNMMIACKWPILWEHEDFFLCSDPAPRDRALMASLIIFVVKLIVIIIIFVKVVFVVISKDFKALYVFRLCAKT